MRKPTRPLARRIDERQPAPYGYGQQRLQERLGLDDEAVAELEG